ncbi:MAG: GNAT family N-acetyltransferase [Bacteroidia bacterium]|nr:GNAT family N-acetyltransferase [Bacteroidia bacterium]MCF8446084.1 GNAT family N-acetyltransferase [Bacteroidia bacterium]
MELRILQQNIDKTDQLFESLDCQSLLGMYEDFYPKIGFHLPWVAYLVVKQNEVVGTCSFIGRPKDGKVEISYWTFKEFEGQGFASFACKELIKIARNADLSVTLTAKTEPAHNASTRILENNNFIFSGIVQDEEIGDAWLWTLKSDEQILDS